MNTHLDSGPGRFELPKELLRMILDSTLEAMAILDAKGRILDWNHRSESLFGWKALDVAGKHWVQVVIPERDRAAQEIGLRHYLETGESPFGNRGIEITALRRDGSEFPAELSVSPLRSGEGWIFTAFLRDLTEWKAVEARLHLQSEVARILAESRNAEEALGAVLETIRRQTSWDVCAFWRATENGKGLALAEMRVAPGAALRRFLEASRSDSFRPEEEFPGQVRCMGSGVWLSPPTWQDTERGNAAMAGGLQVAFGFPILLRGRLLGVFEFHSKAFGKGTELAETFAGICRQVGQFLERRRAEEELHRREEQLRLVIDAVPALVSYIGSDLRYRFNNKAYETWFGAPLADITGKSMWEVLGTAAYERVKPDVDAALAGETRQWEMEVPYRTGGTRFVHAHYLPHRGPDGRTEGFVVLVVDLTERRKLERRLEENEAFLQSIYDGTEAALFVVDILEDGQMVFKGFNPAYVRMTAAFGFDAPKFLGRTTRDLIEAFPRHLVDAVEGKYRECAATGTRMEYQEQVMLEGRATTWLTRLVPLRDGTGHTYRLVGTSTDITGRKEDAAPARKGEDRLRDQGAA